MGCITRKFRGYGFTMMMLQMPLFVIQQMPWVKRRTLLNNVIFWISMILGLSLVSLHPHTDDLDNPLTVSSCAHCMYCYDIQRHWIKQTQLSHGPSSAPVRQSLAARAKTVGELASFHKLHLTTTYLCRY